MSAFPSNQPLLTYEEAGGILGVTGRTIWNMVDRGDLPAVRIGRSVRIDPIDLHAFIERSKRWHTGDTPDQGGVE